MNPTPKFSVHSAIGRFGTQENTNRTPTNSNRFSDSKSILRNQSNEMMQLKEQYMKLKDQILQQRKDAQDKILALERQIRADTKKVESLELEVMKCQKRQSRTEITGSVEVVEKIWKIMTTFRKVVRGELPKSALNSTSVEEDQYKHDLPTPTPSRSKYSRI